MRKTVVTLFALVVISLQGCIVKSVHPFYKETDLDPRGGSFYEGKWVDQDNNEWRIHRNPFKPTSFELHCSKNGREASLLGHFFMLGRTLYIDVVPLSDSAEELLVFDLHLVPTHSIARVDDHQGKTRDEDEILIRWFNEEWLREMFTQNKIRIAHTMIMDSDPKSKDDGTYLLTATTDELQKFILKYGDSEEAFDGGDDLKLQLRRTGP